MTANLDLVARSGPIAGKRIPLNPDEALLFGRTTKGVSLPDPLVSIRHADITWVTDRYYVTDLGSATGTFVDGERVVWDQPKPIDAGSSIRVGETEFQVVSRTSWLPRLLVGAAGASFAGLIIIGLVVSAANPATYKPELRWFEPVKQGAKTSKVLEVPTSYIRQRGIDYRQIKIKKVADFDNNGVHEVWLENPDSTGEVVSFDERGRWKVLSAYPADCIEQKIGTELPDLRCGSVDYRYTDGAYQPYAMEGVVAWMPRRGELASAGSGDAAPKEAKAEAKGKADGEGEEDATWHRYRWAPPMPYRFTMVQRDKLTGFLLDRGIDQPVHYLLCEEAIPGMRAQVLTESGEIRQLAVGCIHSLTLTGKKRTEEFGRDAPVAVAFTASGHEALVQDVTNYLAGSADGIFLDATDQATVDAFGSKPMARIGSIKLSFDAQPVTTRGMAREASLKGVRTLLRSRTARPQPMPAVTASLLTEGLARVDPEGCSELEIDTGPFHCAVTRACTASSGFLAVRQTGCATPSTLLTATYAGGVFTGGDENIEVRVVVKTVKSGRQLDVVQAKVGYRRKNLD